MPNTITPLMPTILARGLQTLRANCWMPRLMNMDFSNVPAGEGDTVNVWIGSALTPSAVSPTAAPVTPQDSKPVKVPIPLDQWRKNGFFMTDKEVGEIGRGLRVKQADEAIKGLAEELNAYAFSKYVKAYGYVGTAGTTPFATDTTAATQASKILNKQRAWKSDRRMVLDTEAEALATELAKLTSAERVGDKREITEGAIGRKLGFDWFMDQQIPTHTSTPLTAGAATANGVNAIGAGSTDNGRTGTVSIAKATNTSPLVAGDIISFAGDAQTYVVLTGVTLAVGNTTVSIAPALQKATAGGEAVTLRASHTVNLAFHKDAFAFASRPLQTLSENSESMISIADPVSGVVLRLEQIRQNKQTYMEFDILYGCELVRPELCVRVAG